MLGSIQAFVERGEQIVLSHHRLDCVESYISELLDNLQEAANSDTPNVIQHNRWVDKFMALRAQLEADKEKKKQKNVSLVEIKPLRRLNLRRNSDFWKETSNMPFSKWKKTKRPMASVFWTVWL